MREYLQWFWNALRTGVTCVVMVYLLWQHAFGMVWPAHTLLLLFLFMGICSLWATVTLFRHWRSVWRRIAYGAGIVVLCVVLRLMTWGIEISGGVLHSLGLAVVMVAVSLPIFFFIGDCLERRNVTRINAALERLNRKK